MLVGVYAIEARFWNIRGYGIPIDTFTSAVGIFGLVLNGPAFILAFALCMAGCRWIMNPWAPLYRVLFNCSIFGVSTVAASAVLMLWLPDISQGPSLTALLVLSLALFVQTIISIPVSSTMIALAHESRVLGHELLREMGQVTLLDPPNAVLALLILTAWSVGGLAGLLLAMTAVTLPGLLIVAPTVTDAWNEALLATATETREYAQARALASEIADEAQAAFLDALTGLGNRLAFEAQMAQPGFKRVVVLADVVGLRAINDSISHDAGDDLLRAAANGLRASIRGRDRAFRIGGDEFVLILEDLPSAGVEPFLARVAARVALEGQVVTSLAGRPLRLRCGWAAGEGDLLAAADAMLTTVHAGEKTSDDPRLSLPAVRAVSP